MKGSTAIRKQLGLTQHQLAGLLQVSRSAINLYELGKRSLPVAAMIRLAQLEISYNQAQQQGKTAFRVMKTAASEENTRRLTALLQGKIQACRDKAALLQQQLDIMQQEHNRMAYLLIAMGTWHQQIHNTEPTAKLQLQIEIMQYELQQKMIWVRREEQCVLQHEINIQVYMAAAYESALDKLNRGEV